MQNLKSKLLWTIWLLVIFRIVAQIPVPGADLEAIRQYFSGAKGGGVFDLINTFTGGSFKRFSVLALGIMPYITTSIIFSLLGEVIPTIKELQEDSDGYKKIQKWVRYCTVGLCLIQGYGMATVFESFRLSSGALVIQEPGLAFKCMTALTLTTGTIFLMWLGERITEYGIENGTSLIIFAGIVVDLPTEFFQKLTLFKNGELSFFAIIVYLLILIACFASVCFFERAYRNISVQYAKRVVNNKVYGGGMSALPMKVDTAGVMPPILASSLLMAPATLSNFVSPNSFLWPFISSVQQSLVPGRILFNVLFSLLIAYMTFFYAPIQFKTKKISEMLQKNNAFVPGVRPGVKTKEFLDFVLFRLSFVGAFFLVAICIVPTLFSKFTDTGTRLGGTALLILVGVAIRAMQNIQSFAYAGKYQDSYQIKSKGGSGVSRRRF